MTVAIAVARWLGLPGLIFFGMLIIYEGLPLGPLRDVPFVGPALSVLVDGRVDRVAAEAVKGKVSEFELARERGLRRSAEIVAATLRDRAAAAEIALANFETRAAQDAQALENADDQIRELLARPVADDCRVDGDLLDRLRGR